MAPGDNALRPVALEVGEEFGCPSGDEAFFGVVTAQRTGVLAVPVVLVVRKRAEPSRFSRSWMLHQPDERTVEAWVPLPVREQPPVALGRKSGGCEARPHRFYLRKLFLNKFYQRLFDECTGFRIR